MISITQLQEYLHHIAQQQYELVKNPTFTLYFHPSNTLWCDLESNRTPDP